MEQEEDYIDAIGRWVEEKQQNLIVDEQHQAPVGLELSEVFSPCWR